MQPDKNSIVKSLHVKVCAVIVTFGIAISFLPLLPALRIQGQAEDSVRLTVAGNYQDFPASTAGFSPPTGNLSDDRRENTADPAPANERIGSAAVLETANADAAEAPAAEVAAAAPVQPMQPAAAVTTAALAENELIRNLQVRIRLTNRGDTSSNNIRMEIPLLANLNSPYQELLQERFSHQPSQLMMREMGGRAKLVEIPSLQPGSSQTITLNYTLAARRPGAEIFSGETDLSQFLAPSPRVESDRPEIVAAAQRIAANAASAKEQARAFYSFVIRHMSYSLETPHRNRGAISALVNGEGVCEDYASLFVALCRAAGIPARVVKGYADPGGTGDTWQVTPGRSVPLAGYRHAWAEFFVDGRGWLPADPTFESSPHSFKFFASLPHGSRIAQNYLDQALRARFRGGELVVTWDESLVSI